MLPSTDRLGKNRGVTDVALDEINKQIIEHLQRDGRMSYATLAKTIIEQEQERLAMEAARALEQG